MRIRSIALTISLIISTGSLGAGYILAGYWQILPVFFLLALMWILSKKQPVFWPASGFLFVYVILSAIGVIINLSLGLMIVGCIAALASWDLVQFNRSMAETSLASTDPLLEKYHLSSLVVASALGLVLALVGSSISLRLPFVVILALVLIGMGCLLYGTKTLMKRKP